MKNWEEQAEKNGLHILKDGPCQLCGAPVTTGISECVAISHSSPRRLQHEEGVESMSIFLAVDAYALQHSEIHGRWSNHLHLTRLHLILDKNVVWNYKLTPLLSEILNAYKAEHPNDVIAPPKVQKRGGITALDIQNAKTEEGYIDLVKQWGKEVYESFASKQDIAERVATLFLEEHPSCRFPAET